MRRSRVPWVPIVVVVILLVCAVFASQLSPFDPNSISLSSRRIPPFTSSAHLLGTDVLGRDMLSRLIFGARNTTLISVTSLVLGATVGTLLGLTAGYAGGLIDTVIARVVDAFLGFPSVLVALVVVSILGTGVLNVLLAISLTTWPRVARVVRGEAIANKQRDYVSFARTIGVPKRTIVTRHIFPQVISVLTIMISLLAAEVILLEASLAFLGLGFQPGAPAWGLMVAEGRQVIGDMWWLSTLPGLAIVTVVLSLNFFGDWLRDALDPRLRIS